MMRASVLFSLMIALFLIIGCEEEPSTVRQTDAAGASRGISLYPLSTPPPAAAQPIQGAPTQYATASPGYVAPYATTLPATTAQGAYYAPAFTTASSPAYCPPAYCPDPLTPSYAPTTIVIPDPPVIVDNVYYPSTTGQAYVSGPSYSTTTTYATTTSGRVTSPYDSLQTYQTTTTVPTYSSTYTTTTYTTTPVPQTTSYPVASATTYTSTMPTSPYSSPALVPTYGTPESVASMTSPFPVGADTLQLVPATDIPSGIHPNDAGPSQWFEILRPGNGPIRIGRVSSTCVCVGVRVPNRHIAAGQRALIEARTLTRPPVRNVTYGIYVNVEEPEKTVLDADVTIP